MDENIKMKLYGKEKSENDIKNFVLNYVTGVKNSENDRYHKILSFIPDGNGVILDYGCGWGHYAVALSKKGYFVHATDISINEIDICKLVWGELPNVLFENKEIAEYEDYKFDYVISSQVIEHVHNPGNYLSNINRVLKKMDT